MIAWLQRSPSASVYFSSLTVAEVLGVPDNVVVKRLAAIGELCGVAPGRVRVAAGLVPTILAELEGFQKTVVEDATFDPKVLISADLKTLRGYGRMLREVAAGASQGKDFGFGIDLAGPLAYQKEFGVQFDVGKAVAMVDDPGPLAPWNFGLQSAVAIGGGRVTAEQLAGNTRRYPVSNLFGHFAFRQMLANAVPRTEGHPSLGLFRTKKKGGRGDWFDAGIAATAALADRLVSDDAELKRRCDWLRARRLLNFETVMLADLLKRG